MTASIFPFIDYNKYNKDIRYDVIFAIFFKDKHQYFKRFGHLLSSYTTQLFVLDLDNILPYCLFVYSFIKFFQQPDFSEATAMVTHAKVAEW